MSGVIRARLIGLQLYFRERMRSTEFRWLAHSGFKAEPRILYHCEWQLSSSPCRQRPNTRAESQNAVKQSRSRVHYRRTGAGWSRATAMGEDCRANPAPSRHCNWFNRSTGKTCCDKRGRSKVAGIVRLRDAGKLILQACDYDISALGESSYEDSLGRAWIIDPQGGMLAKICRLSYING
jgi:hypothetical protein